MALLDGPNPGWVNALRKHRGVLIPIGFVMMLAVLLVPMPPMAMDILICLNIAVGVIILMTTMYMDGPLDFSVFPSLLLATTLMRLVLNIASTRLILTADADTPEEAMHVAGHVIAAFGSFVAGGSMFVGVIIFMILVIVQFVVITKGATRIGEVAARFTLDAMPGKQMAIDADLNAGIISDTEARRRREEIRAEADFYGAMDGAGKFVRGDAVAGILITFINIAGGFAIGAVEKGWDIAETARVFTILTIGDGLAAQIPSLVISLAAALIVTRSGARANLGEELTGQLASRPAALFITAGFIAALAITPLPTVPLLVLALGVGAIGLFTVRGERLAVAEKARVTEEKSRAEATAAAPPVEDLLKVDTLELEIGYGLVPLVDTNQGGELLDRISAIRRQLAAEMGFVMPPVRIRDNMTLAPEQYNLKVRGATVATGKVEPTRLMAMDSGVATGPIQGVETIEPAFGLRAWWIDPKLKTRAETLNYTVVDPTSVLTTHLLEVVRRHADELLTREEVGNLIEQLKQRAPRLIEQAIPSLVSPGDLQKVLQGLLLEGVPIRDLETIVETLSDWSPRTKDTEVLTEYVRNALRRSICLRYAQPGDALGGGKPRIVCVTLDPGLEDFINGYIDRSTAGASLAMPADAARLLARQVSKSLESAVNEGHTPIVIASPQVRAQVRQALDPFIPGVVVLAYNEITREVELESRGLVEVPESVGAAA